MKDDPDFYGIYVCIYLLGPYIPYVLTLGLFERNKAIIPVETVT